MPCLLAGDQKCRCQKSLSEWSNGGSGWGSVLNLSAKAIFEPNGSRVALPFPLAVCYTVYQFCIVALVVEQKYSSERPSDSISARRLVLIQFSSFAISWYECLSPEAFDKWSLVEKDSNAAPRCYIISRDGCCILSACLTLWSGVCPPMQMIVVSLSF